MRVLTTTADVGAPATLVPPPRDPQRAVPDTGEEHGPQREHDRLAWRRRIAWACVGVDFVAISVAVVALLLADPVQRQMSPRAIVFAVAEVPLWLVSLNLCRAHEPRFLAIGSEEFRRVFDGAVRLAAVVALAAYGTRASLPRSLVAMTIPFAVTLDLAGRYGVRKVVHQLRRRDRCVNRLLLVGGRRSVSALAAEFRRSSYVGMSVIGCCVDGRSPRGSIGRDVPVLGASADAVAVATQQGATAIAVTGDVGLDRDYIRQLAWSLEGTHIELMVSPGLTDCVGPRIHIRPVAGLPLLHIEKPQLSGGHRLLKSAIDRLVAAVAFALLLPLLGTIGVVVRMTSPGPALFRQRRVGRGGREFVLYKFRTMYRDAEATRGRLELLNMHGDGPLFKLRDDPRITPVGRFLRKYSLDELPQLLNVVKGDMSLVGPRPPLPSEVAAYVGSTGRRMLVQPGLTGLWQISGRADLDWRESVRLDLYYVENWSLALDALILWKTVPAVLRHRGAY